MARVGLGVEALEDPPGQLAALPGDAHPLGSDNRLCLQTPLDLVLKKEKRPPFLE